MNFKFSSLIFKMIFFFPSLLWEWIYRIRRFAYNYRFLQQNHYQVPIISVGNLTFGGTGKTPFILWLSEFLDQHQKKVVILMRGYKGGRENSKGILRGGKGLGFNPLEYGDEALVLARGVKNASIIVGKNRSENLEYYFEAEKPDVVLMDDGHQHLKIWRTLNIVLFDALMPLARYKVAPLGYLREGMTSLKDAELIVITRADQVGRDKIEALKNIIRPHIRSTIPFGEVCYKPVGLRNANYNSVIELDELKDQKVICVAGIASPLSFFTLIELLGADVIRKVSFPDHHFFKTSDMIKIINEAKEEDALIITTEKDIVKMRRIIDDDRILYLEIKVAFMKGEEQIKQKILASL